MKLSGIKLLKVLEVNIEVASRKQLLKAASGIFKIRTVNMIFDSRSSLNRYTPLNIVPTKLAIGITIACNF